jgi:hypothetical protein
LSRNRPTIANVAVILGEPMFIDTNRDCTKVASHFVKRGVEAVGRYYAASNGSKVIKKPEAQALSSKGIKIFTIYEDFGAADKLKLTAKRGRKDGSTAKKQANAIGQPQGSVIYFAVEGLPHGYTESDLPAIRDYFAGVKEALDDGYTVGVYGDGIVCKTLLDENICTHTWLAQASYTFEGSIDFYASKRWSLAQIVTDLDKKYFRISADIDETNGDTGSFLVPTAATSVARKGSRRKGRSRAK